MMRVAARYSTIVLAPGSFIPIVSTSQRIAAGWSSSRSAISWRSRETSSDSSFVRPGASPNQNGSVGGCPFASATRTCPDSTLTIRYDVLPSRKMSPGELSIAKSSLSVPTNVSVGSRITR